MKKVLGLLAATIIGYTIFYKVQENMQRQAVWHQVTDPVVS